jgi:hypothetical protein
MFCKKTTRSSHISHRQITTQCHFLHGIQEDHTTSINLNQWKLIKSHNNNISILFILLHQLLSILNNPIKTEAEHHQEHLTNPTDINHIGQDQTDRHDNRVQLLVHRFLPETDTIMIKIKEDPQRRINIKTRSVQIQTHLRVNDNKVNNMLRLNYPAKEI